MLSLKRVRDEDLLRQLSRLVKQSRRVEAEIVAHIAEVERRRLYARHACSSMFDYCRRILGLRENEAYLRITVSRAAREHPVLLEMLGDGRLHLSGIARLAPHLTRENAEALLGRACGMSHREMRELVAELEPRPDIAATVRKLKERTRPERPLPDRQLAERQLAKRRASVTVGYLQLGAPRVESDVVNLEPEPGVRVEVARGHIANGHTAPGEVAPGEASGDLAGGDVAGRDVAGEDVAGGDVERGDVVRPGMERPFRAPAPARPPLVEPLAPGRYLVRFTASAELREKLERLQALMRSSVPDGDLGRIIDIAISEKLERVEAKRFGLTKAPRPHPAAADTNASSRHIPAAVRRQVHARDGGRCAYRDRHGQRCARRHDLEFHHRRPFARGGDHSADNLTLMCRAHNTLLAEQDYGEGVMARFRGTSRPTVPVDASEARIVVRARGLSSG